MTQIKHCNPSLPFTRATFAISLPSKSSLLNLIPCGVSELTLNFGISYVHPKDQYNKKVGRLTSTLKMSPKTFFLDHIETRDKNRVVYVYSAWTSDRFNKEIEFGISFVPESENTRLEYIIFKE